MKPKHIGMSLVLLPLLLLTACADIALYRADDIIGIARNFSPPECPPPEACG